LAANVDRGGDCVRQITNGDVRPPHPRQRTKMASRSLRPKPVGSGSAHSIPGFQKSGSSVLRLEQRIQGRTSLPRAASLPWFQRRTPLRIWSLLSQTSGTQVPSTRFMVHFSLIR
jgi:hypothetical protein